MCTCVCACVCPVDNNQRETARRLAEVYGDFGALISLAESVGDDQQLMKYMCRFAEEVQ